MKDNFLDFIIKGQTLPLSFSNCITQVVEEGVFRTGGRPQDEVSAGGGASKQCSVSTQPKWVGWVEETTN